MGRTERTIKNAFFGVLSKMLNILIIFGTRTVFIYTLGAEYLGVSGLFTSILTMLSLAELGFAEAITYNLYKPIAENDTKKISTIMQFFKKIYILIGCIVLLLGLILTPWIENIIKDVPNITENIKVIYILYVINSAISYFYVYKSTLLEANQGKYLISIINTITTFIKSIINCIILIITRNFILYLAIEILGTMLYNIIISWISQKRYSEGLKKVNIELPNEEKKSIFRNVKAMFFYKVANVVLTSTDNLIINGFINTIAVGVYSNYTLIINQLYTFILQIFSAATASLGNLAAVETKERQYEIFKKMLFLSFIIYCICCTMFFTLVNPFIKLWAGEQYVLQDITIVIITINFYLTGILTIIASFITTNGLFVKGQYRPIIMAIINVIVSILLVKPLGINGVILGTIISRLVTQCWYDPYLIYKNIFKEKVSKFFIENFKYMLVITITTVISTVIIKCVTIPNVWGNLLIRASISFIIPVLTIIIIYRKKPEFKYYHNIILKMLEDIKSKLGRNKKNAN